MRTVVADSPLWLSWRLKSAIARDASRPGAEGMPRHYLTVLITARSAQLKKARVSVAVVDRSVPNRLGTSRTESIRHGPCTHRDVGPALCCRRLLAVIRTGVEQASARGRGEVRIGIYAAGR